MRLNEIGDVEITDKFMLMKLTEDIKCLGVDPLNSLANLLIDEVEGYHLDPEDKPMESAKLSYLVYEIRNYAEDLRDALECCFKNTDSLIPSDQAGKKEVCHE